MIIPANYSQRMNNFLKGDVKIDFTENERSAKFKAIVEILKRMLSSSRNKQMRIKWSEILQQIYKIVGVE